MKILYVTADESSMTGSENNGFYIRQALKDAGVTLIPFNPTKLELHEKAIFGPVKVGYGLFRRNFQVSLEPLVAKRRARDVLRAIRRVTPDLVFANAPSMLYGLPGEIRSIVYTDAPVSGLIEMGEYYDKWPQRSRERFLKIEASALANASKVIYHSEWAATKAKSDHCVLPEKVCVVYPGANMEFVSASTANLRKGKGQFCEILFWGRDWHRKGGPEAVEIVSNVIQAGVAARLTICGPGALPTSIRELKFVRFMGLLSKNTSAERAAIEDVFRNTDYMLLPTRADASTSAIREASAFGVPSVVTRVGGLPEMIRDGHSGILFQPGSDSAAIARAISHNYGSESQRIEMRFLARQVYLERLNWKSSVSRILEIISDLE